MRFSALSRSVPTPRSLTALLQHFAEGVEARHNSPLPPAGGTLDGLWGRLMPIVSQAHALKETDTTLAVVFSLLRRGHSPPPAMWPVLIRELVPYSDVEANAVLTYPGLKDTRHTARIEDTALLYPTRETLLMTGGVVPLSARVPCSDGVALARLLDAFCIFCEKRSEKMGGIPIKEVEEAVIFALHSISLTVRLTESCQLTRSLIGFFRLLSAEQKHEKYANLTEHFAKQLTKVLSTNALGARMLLLFLADQSIMFPDEMICLPLVRLAFRNVWRYYEMLVDFSCTKYLRQLNEAVDLTLQRNANNGNILHLEESEVADIRFFFALSMLRAMRVEAATPDQFLEDAVNIVDMCSPHLSIEYELIVAKVKLLDSFAGDEDRCKIIYDDLLQSLRALVDLRPQDSHKQLLNMDRGTMQKQHLYEEEEEEEERLLYSQLQDAHRLVLTAFAKSHNEELINRAYSILLTHKYHGLVITKEVIHPLLNVMSRRGDCRVFNIVDLCVLYSSKNIDFETLTYLFRACRVAGEVQRAQALLHLLREVVPGFLLQAPASIRDLLHELGLLTPQPAHLFDTSYSNAHGTTITTTSAASALMAATESILRDGLISESAQGAIRVLPSTAVEQSQKDNRT